MFKNITVYRIPASLTLTEGNFEDVEFVECGASQEKSIGFVPPRAAHGQFVEHVNNQQIMKVMIETKSVPAPIVMREFNKRVEALEQQTGRKPGKKESREIKEDIRFGLLPTAFPKQAAVMIWIDPNANLLVIDSTSSSRLDEVLTLLVRTIEGFTCTPVNTAESPGAVMGFALGEGEFTQGFSIDRECELKASDESKATVRYAKHPLDIDEIGEHIKQGKRVTKLALTWSDKVSFVLTEDLQLKKVAMLDVAMGEGGEEDAFDADVTITTSALISMFADLFDALGGLVDVGDSAAGEDDL